MFKNPKNKIIINTIIPNFLKNFLFEIGLNNLIPAGENESKTIWLKYPKNKLKMIFVKLISFIPNKNKLIKKKGMKIKYNFLFNEKALVNKIKITKINSLFEILKKSFIN